MTYSIDLRKRVVSFVESGGSKAEASHRFSVSRRTVHYWLKREDISPKQHGFRQRKLDKSCLKRHVDDYPDALLRERAAYFGVHTNAIWVALQAMNIRKKNSVDI